MTPFLEQEIFIVFIEMQYRNDSSRKGHIKAKQLYTVQGTIMKKSNCAGVEDDMSADYRTR